MKNNYLIIISLFTVVVLTMLTTKGYSQQQEKFSDINFLIHISNFLKTSIDSNDKRQSSIDQAYFLKLEQKSSYFLRIPFKNKSITTDFIALEMDSNFIPSKGSIVHIIKNINGYSYLDTVNIYTLKREKKWTVYLNNDSKTFKNNKLEKSKVLDEVIVTGSNDGKLWSLNLNIFAILNPGTIEPMQDNTGFGVKPSGGTSGGFGTYSYYFDANLSANNFLPPVATKVEFERPEGLK